MSLIRLNRILFEKSSVTFRKEREYSFQKGIAVAGGWTDAQGAGAATVVFRTVGTGSFGAINNAKQEYIHLKNADGSSVIKKHIPTDM